LLRVALIVLALASACPEGSRAASGQAGLEAVAKTAADIPRLHSLLVSHQGTLGARTLLQRPPGDPARQRQSVSKSVISALIGIAIDQNHMPNVREPIGTYFPGQLRGDANAARRAITVEDLLTMRSGLESTSGRNYGAWVTSKNWVRYALTRELETPPGAEMEYSTGNSHLLSAILTIATKKSTWQYAQEVLARPLGFSLVRWPQDPQGVYFGGNDMLFTPRQLVTFGELYLHRGRHGDRQIVPALGRRFFRPTRAVGLQRSVVRLWLVDARVRGGAGVFRVGLRRSVRLHHPAPPARRRDDVVNRDGRGAPGAPAHHLRFAGGRDYCFAAGGLGLSMPSVSSI